MPTPTDVLLQYQSSASQDERAVLARYLVRVAQTDESAIESLLYMLNDENNTAIRREITRFLAAKRPLKAVHALAKQMFDPDQATRAHAAIGIAGYDSAWTLAPCIAQILDALNDGSTRFSAASAVLLVTGKAADRITSSERERVRRGETAETVWPERFAIKS